MSELKISDSDLDVYDQTTCRKVSLKDYRGKSLVIYFFVKYQTIFSKVDIKFHTKEVIEILKTMK